MSVRSSGHSPGKFCTYFFFLRTCASNPGCKVTENRALIFEKQHLLHCMIRSSAQLLKTLKKAKKQPCESGRGDGRKNCFPFPINRSRLAPTDPTALTGRADSPLFIGSGRRLGQIQGVRWKSGRPWPLNVADCLNPGNGPYLGDLQK